ncbi:MAG: radical SAM protein [Deltaproteobacteria bacterium]|jgi:nitrogenase molybdenum-iron protein alpha/beta subunit/MoaA/NifB/PqqE/SkfB family radical SAM enzyme|nr:radical SAM protein [Deltaproteobacteria bacterium]
MKDRLTVINANPCKMCFPLGVVTAFYGIQKSLSLLHGSQGCSVYIRRHMATHYNEPVDIASSSLTEEGTVFGGEANLIKGLDNLIRLYAPEVIGVGTTCLAETIGEDTLAIIERYQESKPGLKTRFIAVPSPGYAGTHYEGWFAGTRAAVASFALKGEKTDLVNVFIPPTSPADARALKSLLDESGLNYALFPDISYNLDRPYDPVYQRLPGGGTPFTVLEKMGGAKATLELSRFCPPQLSAGAYLEETFGVPLIRLNPPIGLRDNDEFLKAIKSLGGQVSSKTLGQRGRFLDAMLDGHKYNALGRAGIYGDPDLVYGLVRLCVENGLPPVVAATGGTAKTFREVLAPEIAPVIDNLKLEKSVVVDEADFDEIGRLAKDQGVNLLVGSSEGRRLAEKESLPLVRCAFPVHDRQGGSRIRLYGYDGATQILDDLTNAIRGQEESSYRGRLLKAHHNQPIAPTEVRPKVWAFPQPPEAKRAIPLVASGDEGGCGSSGCGSKAGLGDVNTRPAWGLTGEMGKTEIHPCFSLDAAHKNARLHLPVAPACNISCGYCRRDLDCPNESRPGVTSKVLNPQEALERFVAFKERLPTLKVVGVAGPGEALANFKALAQTLTLIREVVPDIAFCLSTNGLSLPYYIKDLYDLGVGYLTVTINTLDAQVGAKIYKEVKYLGQTHQGVTGAALLLANQLAGLKMAVDLGLTVKVNTVVLKGINELEAPKVAKEAAKLGAKIGNVMQHIPVSGSLFGHLPQISRFDLQKISWECQTYLPQSRHCRQCRADAAGLLSEDLSWTFREGQKPLEPPVLEVLPQANEAGKVRVAVVSKSGVVVDQHFGQAERFFIYESDGQSLKLLENRRVALGQGGGCGGFCGAKDPLTAVKPEGFIARLVAAATDCHAVVATRVGQSPKDKLAAKGVLALASYDSVERAVLAAARETLSQRALTKEDQMVS